MKTIFIITAVCWILYKSGCMNKFLQLLRTEPEPVTIQDTTPPPAPDPYEQHRRDREQWENDARYILTMQGYKNPDTVRYMGDEMLIAIIKEYLTTQEIL